MSTQTTTPSTRDQPIVRTPSISRLECENVLIESIHAPHTIERMKYIYGLPEPDEDVCRYIGKCSGRPARRLQQHIRKNHGTTVSKWIEELKSAGRLPRMLVLFEGCGLMEWTAIRCIEAAFVSDINGRTITVSMFDGKRCQKMKLYFDLLNEKKLKSLQYSLF